MKLFERDYNHLNEEEIKAWEKVKQKEVDSEKASKWGKRLLYEYPKAVRHYLSLFPNNYMDYRILWDEEYLRNKIDEFIELVENTNNRELEILEFINAKKSFFIIGSIFTDYNFGHHDSYLFPEFQLGTSYKVDYLLLGKNSGGYEFIFVELQNSHGRIINKNGDLGDETRKGLSQIDDWDEWIDSHYHVLSEKFDKIRNPKKNLPQEFYKLDKSRIHYVVVAGRRTDYKNKTYRLRRKLMEERKINLLHYDNLIDLSKNFIGKATY